TRPRGRRCAAGDCAARVLGRGRPRQLSGAGRSVRPRAARPGTRHRGEKRSVNGLTIDDYRSDCQGVSMSRRTMTAVLFVLALAPARGAASQTHSVPAGVMFDTPEADRVLAGLQIFPPDNPWNEDISSRPVAPDSAAIIASIGADKPLGYNLDMNF